MENSNNNVRIDRQSVNGLKSLTHPRYHSCSAHWLDMRVFYLRASNFVIDDLTPEHFTLNHIPLGPETIFEVNGGRSSAYSDYASVQLRRDRVDKNSEEATFVCTDSVRISGNVRYEVCAGKDILLSGVLMLSDGNDSVGEVKGCKNTWNIKCRSHAAATKYFLKGEQFIGSEVLVPTVEVCVAGCFTGTPIFLTKILQIGSANKSNKTSTLESVCRSRKTLESIPESKSTELAKDVPVHSSQVLDYKDYESDHDVDDEYNGIYSEEDGELSWFNAGVRVGVGIGLGICIGVGLGVGLLVRSYQATSRSFRRRL